MGGIEVIDPRYQALLEHAHGVLDDDARVRAVSISGSVGAATADKWSDLDLAIVTEPDRYDEFLADWPNWLARITPTVFARTPIGPFIITPSPPKVSPSISSSGPAKRQRFSRLPAIRSA